MSVWSPTRVWLRTVPAGRRAYVTGANKAHTHLRGVVLGRDVVPEYADLREAAAGEGCPECGAPLRLEQVIEVGNIFKLGTKYSVPLGATVLDEGGVERPIVMGSYGIGPARIAAAAVEQSNDERGILWPKAIAPFDVHLVQVQVADDTQTSVAAAPLRPSGGRRLGVPVGRSRRAARGQVRRRRPDRVPGAGDRWSKGGRRDRGGPGPRRWREGRGRGGRSARPSG